MAEAGALDAFGPRRQVLWQLSEPGIRRFEPLILEENQTPDILASLSAMERIAWDQRRTAHSTRGHPFELLRATCDQHGFTPSSRLKLCDHQQRVSCVGLVICRQRPSTASGVTFVTLEDESGFINLVIWKDTAERFQEVLKGSSVLAASGRVQREKILSISLFIARLPEWKNTIEPVPSQITDDRLGYSQSGCPLCAQALKRSSARDVLGDFRIASAISLCGSASTTGVPSSPWFDTRPSIGN